MNTLLAHIVRLPRFGGPEVIFDCWREKIIELIVDHSGRTGIWHATLQTRFFPGK